MNQHKFSIRVTLLMAMIAVIVGIFCVKLYRLQVIEAEAEADSLDGFTYYTRVKAARGEILDCNGNVLIGNRASFNLVLVNDVLFSAENPNENLRRLTNLCMELGLEFTDHLPVTMKKPYEYTTKEYSSIWNDYFKTFLMYKEWDTDISAPQLIRRLRDNYNIPADWTEEEARRVISVRYELSLRAGITTLPTYELLLDVDPVDLAELKELNIPGMNVETSTVREYNTEYAAHILGRTGPMDPEEYEYYKEYDYAMDAHVGKEGLEKAFELELHGVDGLRETTIAKDGTILEQKWSKEPKAGSNVELTIDLNIQKVAEDELERLILDLRVNGIYGRNVGKDAEGGAAVVMKVKTGEVLACASYPTFDLATYTEKYNEILQQGYNPLFNRATMGEYPPGSIFKMVTTIAAIDSGTIKKEFEVYDSGVYERFADVGYRPRCMLYTTSQGTQSHGSINVMQALSVSCNYYFYEIGWLTGIDKIDAVAKALGLGEKTGIEIAEFTGNRANPDTKEKIYSGASGSWYGGDTLSAAIGQSEHRYTPMQLCSYVSALANGGTRYKATFLRRVISSDYQELLVNNKPTVLSKLQISEEARIAYVEGMHLAATEGSASSFRNYDFAVCAKTGTAEHGSGGSDNASFVLFGPKDDPEIAVMIYVEKGYQGGNLGKVARAILDAYYSEESMVDLFPSENTLG